MCIYSFESWLGFGVNGTFDGAVGTRGIGITGGGVNSSTLLGAARDTARL